MRLSRQRVLITGAGGGIGSEISKSVARKGAEVVLVGKRADKLHGLKAAIEAEGGRVHGFACDLANPHAPAELAESVGDAIGGVDILINCAGIGGFGMFDRQSPEDLEALWRVNVIAPMQLTRALLPRMMERRHGRIVNIGSIFGSIGFAYFAAYSASKFALRGFSEAIRRELAGSGVGVTYVAPRYTRTPLNDAAASEMAAAVGMNGDDAVTVARHVVRAIEHNRDDYYIGWPESLFVRVNAVLPRLMDGALRRQNDKTRPFAARN